MPIWYIVVAVVALYLLFVFPTQWLKVERVRFDLGLGIRILQISDLHVERLRIGTRRLIQVIREEKPDYIVLTGDFTMKSKHLPKVRLYVEAIGSCGIPAYAVFGNHDHRLPKTGLNQLKRLLEDNGIRVLVNQSARAEGFQFIGIDDFHSHKSRVGTAFVKADSSRPSIILTHDPELVLHLNRSYAYLMAGHLHGKQCNIPFFFVIRPKGKLSRSGIYKGLHKGRYGTFYISKGIGQAGANVRLFVRSEVTVHDL